jgi:hypothetical protein
MKNTMRKPAKTVEECIAPLQAATDALVAERADPETIVKALVDVAIKAGWQSRRPEAVFDIGVKAFSDAAYDAFERAKKNDADKRRKRLGLSDD